MNMLELEQVALQDLCTALEDHSYDHGWWLDPATGAVELWSEEIGLEGDVPDPFENGWIGIEPIDSGDGYGDLADFTERVSDPRARDLLERAIQGRGAFRRFKDTLVEFPDLREAWFAFHGARLERRAIEWLAGHGLLDDQAADAALAARRDPDLPGARSGAGPLAVAQLVADDLAALYGERLRHLVLFGSWARGDAHPESDVDLLVVLDRVDSAWEEQQRMDAVLWQHSIENDVVVAALPVALVDFERPEKPLLIRARAEGVALR